MSFSLIVGLSVLGLFILFLAWIRWRYSPRPSVHTAMKRMDRGEHPFTGAEVQDAILRRFGGAIIEPGDDDAMRRVIRTRLEESAELHRRGIPDHRGRSK